MSNNKLNVLTYNIQYDAIVNQNNFNKVKNILERADNPHFIGLQEASCIYSERGENNTNNCDEVLMINGTVLNKYSVIKGYESGYNEDIAILYNTTLFESIFSMTNCCINYNNNSYYRSSGRPYQVGYFKHKLDNRYYLIINIHNSHIVNHVQNLDISDLFKNIIEYDLLQKTNEETKNIKHIGRGNTRIPIKATDNSNIIYTGDKSKISEIVTKLRDVNNDIVVVMMGDFNAEPRNFGLPIKLFEKKLNRFPYHKHTFPTPHITGNKKIFDHIFTNLDVKNTFSEFDFSNGYNRTLRQIEQGSDHYPVFAELPLFEDKYGYDFDGVVHKLLTNLNVDNYYVETRHPDHRKLNEKKKKRK